MGVTDFYLTNSSVLLKLKGMGWTGIGFQDIIRPKKFSIVSTYVSIMAQMPRVEANFAPPEGENWNTSLESPLFIAVRRFPSNTDLISALLQHGLVTQT